MKICYALWAAALLVFSTIRGSAATLYVSLTSTNPVPPYADWSTAATDIQDAIDASSDGDLILVTNGVYQTGGRTMSGYALTNRVVIDKAVMVQSVNGPTATFIRGYQMPGTINGNDAVRCVYMADNASLSGFTLTGGATSNLVDVLSPQDESGGGVWCESSNAIVSNCVITANSCIWYGAGGYSGTFKNCQLINNTNLNGSLGGGGGAAFSTLLNCTIQGNYIQLEGGGVFSCTLSNCALAGNAGGGALGSTLNDCTVSNNVSHSSGGGASQSTLSYCLLCNNQGGRGGGAYNCTLNFCTVSNNVTSGNGGGVCYDSNQTNTLGQGNIIVGNVATDFSTGFGGGVFLGISSNLYNWTFISNSAAGDGGGLYLAGPSTKLNDCTFLGNSSDGNGGGFCGAYPSLTSASNCTFIGNIAVGNGGGAYSAALTNSTVVGNKAGNGGGVYGTINNCTVNYNVATNNGGGLYVYEQAFTPSVITGCALTNNSALNGGGAYVSSSEIGFSNSVFCGNLATNSGGGIDLVSQPVVHCTIVSNLAGVAGGGVCATAAGCALNYCTVSENSAGVTGGGIYDCSIANSLLSANSAAYGGGAFYDNPFLIVLGSTIAGNQAIDAGGGLYWKSPITPAGITNCIIYDNSAPTNMNYFPTNALAYYYCCAVPLPLVQRGRSNSNITNDPAFVNLVGADFHLSSNSPCINSGNNAYVTSTTDLDGDPRIVGGTVDMGAYEYQTPVSKISYAWLQQYALPITPNIDNADLDGTGFIVYQDWIAGLNPTNALSVLAMLPPVPTNNPTGLVVSWESVSNRTYFLQSSTNLAGQPLFSTIQNNIAGQAGTTSFTDTTATNTGPYFYRVGVQQ